MQSFNDANKYLPINGTGPAIASKSDSAAGRSKFCLTWTRRPFNNPKNDFPIELSCVPAGAEQGRYLRSFDGTI